MENLKAGGRTFQVVERADAKVYVGNGLATGGTEKRLACNLT